MSITSASAATIFQDQTIAQTNMCSPLPPFFGGSCSLSGSLSESATAIGTVQLPSLNSCRKPIPVFKEAQRSIIFAQVMECSWQIA